MKTTELKTTESEENIELFRMELEEVSAISGKALLIRNKLRSIKRMYLGRIKEQREVETKGDQPLDKNASLEELLDAKEKREQRNTVFHMREDAVDRIERQIAIGKTPEMDKALVDIYEKMHALIYAA